MDQRTLVVSCVEYYSDLKNIPRTATKPSPKWILISLSA